jgi:hypothetical protein
MQRLLQKTLSKIPTWYTESRNKNLVMELPDFPEYKILEDRLICLVNQMGGFVRKIEIHATEERISFLEEIAATDMNYFSSTNFINEFIVALITTFESYVLQSISLNSLNDQLKKTSNV